LFVAHAKLADREFSASGRDELLVRDICRRLDGIALAIELASASVRVMSLGQLRSRLDGRFRLVAKNRSTPLPRHETMQALIDWSYELLEPRQQTVFTRLSVFTGSFSPEAAVAVAGGSGISAGDVAAGVAELAEKSMLVVDGSRYRMLDSIRQFALEHLREAGDEHERRAALAAYVLREAREAASTFGTGSEEAWLARYVPELDNVRTALDWSIANAVPVAAEIAGTLSDFWEYANVAAEGLRRSEAILAAMEDPNAPAAIPVLVAIAKTALAARIYRRSLECGDRALSMAERAGDENAAAAARRVAGRSRYLLEVEPQLGLSQLRKSLDYVRENGNAFLVARALRDYGSAYSHKDAEAGRKYMLEALELAKTLEWPRLTIHIEINVAEREFRSGNAEQAVARARDVVARLRQRRSPVQLGHALTNLASYLSVTGEFDAAEDAAREAVSIGRAHEAENYEVVALQAAAVVLAHRGELGSAARLLGFVDAYYERYAMTREPTETIVQRRLLDVLREGLDLPALSHETAQGRELSDDAAIELAFSTPARSSAAREPAINPAIARTKASGA
ncbi:MAG: hypothetical protein JO199_14430, partial [Candidatus Eremiobacteraeota bacterium]|nr:hypothetical protein [Candidatus Eremiobacteraeota bacterium]